MADWQTVRVRDLVSSGVLQVSDGYRVTNRELGTEGVPFVRGGDIGGSGQINHAVDDHIRPEFYERITNKLTRPCDVAFITKGTVGRVGFVREDQPPMVFAPQVCYWRVLDTDQLDPRFVFYMLSGADFQANLDAVKTHGSMVADYVSIADQQSFLLALPPIEEQRMIAEVLGTLDDKLAVNRSTSETIESIIRAIFRERVILASEDAGWPTTPLDGIASFLNGLAMQKYPAGAGGALPVIKIAELRSGVTDRSDRASMDVPAQYVVQDGDLLFSWSGSLEVAVWTGGPGALNQHLFKVSSERYPRWFVRQWLLHHLPTFRGIAADKATTMGHIQRRHLTEAQVALPDRDRLAALNDVIAPLEQRIVTSAIESRTLTTLRDTLLRRLLSGELHVRDPEPLVAVAV